MAFIGLIPAAGRSSRMGQDKRLLRYGRETFVDVAIRTLVEAGCDEVIVITDPNVQLAPADSAIEALVRRLTLSAPTVTMRETLEHAVPWTTDADLLAVLPVDCPGIPSALVATLYARFADSDADGLVPFHCRQQGHPRFLRGRLFRRVRGMAPGERFSAIFGLEPGRIVSVNVADKRITGDIDTPADLEALKRGIEDSDGAPPPGP